MGIGVLGPLMVGGETSALGPRDRIVLAALVAQRGVVASAESLADALWGDTPPASWHKVVQGCVMRLRKMLGPGAIETHPQGYSLVVAREDIDAFRFERLVSRAQELLTLNEPDRAAHLLDEALALWRGRALSELEDWPPGHIEAERLEELRQDAEELRVDAALRAGRWRDVLTEAKARVSEAPFREHRWTLLALAQYQAGRQGDALRTLRHARTVLTEELGLDPGPDIVALEDAILQQDPALLSTVAPQTSSVCPYLGLVPYDVGDADAFFGRDEEVAECLKRLTDTGALAVMGPSGSGKSSLVRAGVMAALEVEDRPVVVVTPGVHPMDALSGVPMNPPPVLVVDQCEEAVTVCKDSDEQARFFAALSSHAEQGLLVVALRADRLGELSAHPEFARIVEQSLYLLKAMEENDLRAAIEGPSRQAGLLLEPGLVDLLVREVEDEPGALPLLSHALRQTWERREGRTLTVDGYQASGGIRGAVARSAEKVYESAAPEKRPILRELLLRLVTPSPEGEPVRSRVPRRIVASDPAHEQVIEELVSARLITSDEDAVELAHEALARAWPRLRGWLDDDLEGQRLLRHLSLAADTWEGMGRPDSELYRGVRLAQTLEWRARASPDINQVETAFLESSQNAAEAERRAVRRRRRLLVSGLAAGLLITTVLAGITFVSRQGADRAADLARSRELAAAAINVIDTDPGLSKLLAVASTEFGDPTVESIAALHQAWAAARVDASYRWPDDQEMWALIADVDPSGRYVVAAADADYLEVVDLTTGEQQWSHTTNHDLIAIAGVAFGEDGDVVFASHHQHAASEEDGDKVPAELLGLYVLDARTGSLIERHDLGRCGGVLAGLAGPKALVVTQRGLPEEETCGTPRGVAVELLDLGSGTRELITPWSSFETDRGVTLSADGQYAAFAEMVTEDGTSADPLTSDPNQDTLHLSPVVVDLTTGRRVLTVDPTLVEVVGFTGVRGLSPDGSRLLFGGRPVQVWDVATGELISSFDGHRGESLFSVFDQSGNSVYSVGVDGTLRRWDAETGQQVLAVPAVGHGPLSVLNDGRVLVADVWGRTAVLVDPRVRGEIGAVETCSGDVPRGGLDTAAGLAVLRVACRGATNSTTQVVDLLAAELIYSLEGQHGQPEVFSRAVAIAPDGGRFARQEGQSDRHGPLVVRDLHTGDKLLELKGLCTWSAESTVPPEDQGCRQYPGQPFAYLADRIRWSPDGSIITANIGTELVAWDAEQGHVLFAQEPREGLFLVDWIFTPDSQHIIVSREPDGILLVSADTGEIVEEVGRLRGTDLLPDYVGYSPDGSTLYGVVGGPTATGQLQWIDAESLELIRFQDLIHDGAVRSAALSPDGTRIATGASDGRVRVWDSETGDLVHEIPVEGVGIQGVAFVDDVHLAVTPDTGNVLLFTVDRDEVLDIVRVSLTRGFSATECQRFNFGDDCPTLAELRNG